MAIEFLKNTQPFAAMRNLDDEDNYKSDPLFQDDSRFIFSILTVTISIVAKVIFRTTHSWLATGFSIIPSGILAGLGAYYVYNIFIEGNSPSKRCATFLIFPLVTTITFIAARSFGASGALSCSLAPWTGLLAAAGTSIVVLG